MANLFVNLPAPAANGAGTAVGTSAYGAVKTITVEGNGGVFEPFVLIEIANDAAGAEWLPLYQFYAPGVKTLEVACRWMRATVMNYRGGGAPTVNLGGADDATSFAQLVAPTGNADGTPVDTSALPLFKTIVVGGTFRGALVVEVSTDGGVSFAQAYTVYEPTILRGVFAADYMRVSRNGVPLVSPGMPTVDIAASSSGGGDEVVATDGTTIAGDGTESNPLHVVDPLPIGTLDISTIERFAAAAKIAWSSTASPSGTADTALQRVASGRIEVNNGNASTRRDMIMRTLYADAAAGTAPAVAMRDTGLIGWSSTSDPLGARDVGISRNAVNVVEINTGTPGALGGIRARFAPISDYVRLSSTGIYGWSSTVNPGISADTGISRSAAGVVEINNGTAGTLADLSARAASFSGLVSGTSAFLTSVGGFAFRMRDTGIVAWSSTAGGGGTPDTGIARNAAGVVEINNGTAGTLADLSARAATFSRGSATTATPLTVSNPTANAGATVGVVLTTNNSTQSGTWQIDGGGAMVFRLLTGTNAIYFDARAGGTYFRNAGFENVLRLDNSKNAFFYGNGSLASGGGLKWTASATDPTAAPDTGIARNAAGLVEINSGTAGDYRDLQARNITTTSTVIIGGTLRVAGSGGIQNGSSGTAAQWRQGTGSPEGVVTAPPGSFYSNTSGGAGASFWVKESGTGNTGWVAK